jgi:hypothetical protein
MHVDLGNAAPLLGPHQLRLPSTPTMTSSQKADLSRVAFWLPAMLLLREQGTQLSWGAGCCTYQQVSLHIML